MGVPGMITTAQFRTIKSLLGIMGAEGTILGGKAIIKPYLQGVQRQVSADVGVQLRGAAPGQQQAQLPRAAHAGRAADDDVAAVAEAVRQAPAAAVAL